MSSCYLKYVELRLGNCPCSHIFLPSNFDLILLHIVMLVRSNIATYCHDAAIVIKPNFKTTTTNVTKHILLVTEKFTS